MPKKTNREIKFRAWDKRNKLMIDFNLEGIDMFMLQISSEGWQIEFDNSEDDKKYFGKEEFELMQFTGLFDKNGVEIYEGDIVSIGNGEFDICGIPLIGGSGTHVVEYYEKYGEFINTHTENALGETFSHNIEIIGNIYENPELLGDKQ